MYPRHSIKYSGIIGANIRKLRKDNGWTLKDLSARMTEVGYPLGETHLSYIERTTELAEYDKPVRLVDADKLMAFSKAFNIPMAYLFTE